ncbi:DUF4262 domain-containing protein [Lacunimicrobium album]
MSSYDEDIEQSVGLNGWDCIAINDAVPPFAYTVGLIKTVQHPELIIFGLNSRTAHGIFQVLYEDIRDGKNYYTPGRYVLSRPNFEVPIQIRRVDRTQHELYLGFAMAFCRRMTPPVDLQVLQVFWPDQNGKFPFEAGCEIPAIAAQPRLDEPASQDGLDELHRQFE